MNGRTILENETAKLTQNSVIEIAQLKLTFTRNENYQKGMQVTRQFGGVEQAQNFKTQPSSSMNLDA